MKHSLIFLVIVFSLSFGDIFPPETIQKTSVVGIELPTCLVQNCIDSLVYVVSYAKDTRKSIIFIFNEEIQLIDTIVFDSAGDSISAITAIYNDSLRLAFASGEAIYLLEAGKLKKKVLAGIINGGAAGITFFQEKWYLATCFGIYCYDPVTETTIEQGFSLIKISGIASTENDIWSSGEKTMYQEYFVTQKKKNTANWITTSSKDTSLLRFFEYYDMGSTSHKKIQCTFTFEGNVYVAGTLSLLIKKTITGWEDCMVGVSKKMNFQPTTIIDGMKNVWNPNGTLFILFNLKTKVITEYSYKDNGFPEYWPIYLCLSPFNKSILYFACNGLVAKYDPNQTNISDFKKKLYVPNEATEVASGEIYNVKGRLLARSQNYRLYFLKTQFGFKKIVLKK